MGSNPILAALTRQNATGRQAPPAVTVPHTR